MRIVIIVGVAIVLLVVGALWFLASSLDGLVQRAIETYGSQVAGTEVRLGGVEISLTEGRGMLRDLRIANPPGFSSGDAMRLGEITLGIDLGSLGGEPIVLSNISIIGPEVNAEVGADGKTNIDALRRNIADYSGSSGENSASQVEGETSALPPRIRIAQLTFEEGKVATDTTAVGGDVRSVELPPLRLSDVGGAQGRLPGPLAKGILDAYTRSVAKTVGSSVVRGKAEELIDEKLGGEAGEATKGLLEGILD